MTNRPARPVPKRDFSPISPYQQGKSALEGNANPIKLSSNESPYGPSPRAIEAYHAAADQLFRYPDGGQQDLRQALAEVHGLDADKIVCGNGSDELLGLLINAYAGEGDAILLSENHFVMYPLYAGMGGVDTVLAPETDCKIDVDALLARVSDRVRMAIIANPNTPTGTFISARETRRLRDGLPRDVLLIIDAAYAEYVSDADYSSGLELVDEFENVVATRTFSKIHGLAGLRIGWAYCPPHVMDILERIRSPFNTTSAGLAAAEAAARDTEHVEFVREKNAQSLRKIAAALKDCGLRALPSVTNFYLVDFAGCPGKTASGAARHMESRGVIPRPVNNDGDALRITVGTEEENQAAIDALKNYMNL